MTAEVGNPFNLLPQLKQKKTNNTVPFLVWEDKMTSSHLKKHQSQLSEVYYSLNEQRRLKKIT